MPSVRDILYAVFVLVIILLAGYFLLEFAERVNAAPLSRAWCHPLWKC